MSVESLDQYGINIKVAAMESSAAFKEIANGAQSWDQLTQAQQQQLISMNILSQVHSNFGNGVRNTNTILLQFQAALANVRLALGNTFKVIAAAVLPPLTMLMQALEVVLNKVTQFVTALLGLFGIEVSFEGLSAPSGGSDLGGVGDLGDSIGDIADSGSGVGDTADSLGDVGDAAGDAAEKAAELNKELYGIDEINRIQTKVDSSGSGGSGSGSGSGGAGGLGDSLANGFSSAAAQFSSNNELEKVLNEKASKLANILKSIADAFMEGWNTNVPYIEFAIDNLKAAFERLRESGSTLFSDIWNSGGKELVTNLGSLASAFTGMAVDILAEVIHTIADVFDHINPTSNPAMQYFLSSLNTFVKNVEELVLSLGDHFRSFKDNGGRDFINNLADIGLALGGLAADLGGQAVEIIDNFLDHLDPANNPKTKKMLSSFNYLAQEVEEFILSVGGWFSTFKDNGSQAFVNNLGDIIVSLGDLAAHIGGDIVGLVTDFMNSWVGQALIEGVAKALEFASGIIEDLVTFLADHPGVVEAFLGAWATYKTTTTVIAWANGIALFCSEAKALVTMLGGDLVAKLTGFFGAFKGAGILTGLKGILSGIGGWISGALGAVWGAISGAVSAVAGAIGTALTAIAGFFGISVGWLVAIIAAIIAAVVLIWKNWDKICAWCKKAWKKLCDWAPKAWDKVCKAVNKLIDGIKEAFEKALDEIKKVWSKVEDWASGVKDKVLGAWKDFKSKLGDLFSKAWTFAKDKFKDAKTWAEGIYKKVTDAWKDFKTKMGDTFEKAWTFAKDKFKDAKTWSEGKYKDVTNAWKDFKTNLSTKFSDAWTAAKDNFKDAKSWAEGKYKDVTDAWKDFKSNLSTKFSDAWTSAKDKFKDAWQWAKDRATDIKNGFANLNLGDIIKNAFDTAKGKVIGLWDWGKSKATEIYNGLSNLNLGDKIKSAFDTAKGKVIGLWDWGKSKATEIYNGFANLNFGNTVLNAWNTAKSKIGSVWQWGKDRANDIKNGFANLSLGNVLTNAWNSAKNNFPNVGSWAQGIANTIKNKFSSIGSGVAGAIGSGLKSTINSMLSRVETMINNARTMINKIPGVNIKYISLPRMMATGGLVNGPTSAILGEAGRELVLPLDRNDSWKHELADIMASKINTQISNAGGNSNQPIEVVVKIGDSTFARQTIDSINKEQRKQGKILLDL